MVAYQYLEFIYQVKLSSKAGAFWGGEQGGGQPQISVGYLYQRQTPNQIINIKNNVGVGRDRHLNQGVGSGHPSILRSWSRLAPNFCKAMFKRPIHRLYVHYLLKLPVYYTYSIVSTIINIANF